MGTNRKTSGGPPARTTVKKLLSFPKKSSDHLSQPEAMHEMTVTNT